jgi:hypothetical protein
MAMFGRPSRIPFQGRPGINTAQPTVQPTAQSGVPSFAKQYLNAAPAAPAAPAQAGMPNFAAPYANSAPIGAGAGFGPTAAPATGLSSMIGGQPAPMKKGGAVKKSAKKAAVESKSVSKPARSSASSRADGCAVKGKTKGRMV